MDSRGSFVVAEDTWWIERTLGIWAGCVGLLVGLKA